MKILLVDDNALLLDGLSNLLTKSAYEVVEKAHTIEEALKYFDETEFDILVTDFNIVDDNGLILIRKVKQIYPNLKIIVLSMHDEAHLIKEILKEGVDGYVLRKETHHELVDALDKVKKGKIYLSNEINSLIHNALNHSDNSLNLTDKEKEVLKLIANNHSKKGIATVMHLSDRSVNTICRSLFKKTKTTSIVSLLKFSYANNLV